MSLQVEISTDLSPGGELVVSYDSTNAPGTMVIRLTGVDNSCTIKNVDTIAFGELVTRLKRLFIIAALEEGIGNEEPDEFDDLE